MNEHGIDSFVVHAPYIINLGNSVKPETFELAVEFLSKESERTLAMGSNLLILHPGAHVGAGVDAGTAQIIKGLNEVLTADSKCLIALETMAGKGTEIGKSFEQIQQILEKVELQDKIGVCMDTCHIWDAGYDIVEDLDGVLKQFDEIIGLYRLKAVHLNDSMNVRGSKKDRHAKIGEGMIGKETLVSVINHPLLKGLPFILETPNEIEGWKKEIKMLKEEYKEK